MHTSAVARLDSQCLRRSESSVLVDLTDRGVWDVGGRMYRGAERREGRYLKRLRLVASALTLVLSLIACVPGNPTKSADPSTSVAADKAASDVASQQLADANQLLADREWPKALSALKSLIDSKSFSQLNEDLRYRVLIARSVRKLSRPVPYRFFQGAPWRLLPAVARVATGGSRIDRRRSRAGVLQVKFCERSVLTAAVHIFDKDRRAALWDRILSSACRRPACRKLPRTSPA